MSTAGDPGWDERLGKLLGEDHRAEAPAFIDGLPPGYREVTTPDEAAEDFELASALAPAGPEAGGAWPALGARYRMAIRPPLEPASSFRLRRVGTEPMELTAALPLLESFGLVVVQSLPLLLDGLPGAAVHVDDISVRLGEDPEGSVAFDPKGDGKRLVEAIEAVSSGFADVDPLNQLVVSAGLTWRQVVVVRAHLRYWHQITGLSRRELCAPPVKYPAVIGAIVGYFEARFDPARSSPEVDGSPIAGADRGSAERAACLERLDEVSHLDDYRVLRAALGLVDATLRTNYFGAFAAAERPRLVLKLDGHAVPEMVPPTPLVETFVHGADVEGIHLRAGLIARGGIRWSERPDDFRTEILDLAFAQVKKNSVIVPTGAKGGFVSRTALPPVGAPPARPGPVEVQAAYEAFVAGLLDVTDNIAGGAVATPPRVVAYDGADPYLVVAADKGTAAFSDVANGIAASRRFWLGDAFASGGSHGYDHKAMGITARGAWVSVRRHFRELGVDVATDPIRVVGVGDMSGDVFGNGMLQSRAVRLVAAFDHRHVFIDPEPDAETAFDERRRLAGLARSSWDDYRRDLISAGGGVWPRDARTVPLSPQARRAIGIDRSEVSPPQLVAAILSAPVDLVWFGGIGTFIKASGEGDAEVGDHVNDAVRVTADQVRARVIAEGANLGITQRARIQYSRRGGRINADFIDNAAGVATSDREVNLKILLALAAERGRLDPADRDGFLERAEQQVATEVLRQVDHSVAALNRAARGSAAFLDAYDALIDALAASGALDRDVEVLPSAEELERRRQAGAGLIRPELATLLTFAKSDVVAALESSPLSASAALLDSAVDYFPDEMRSAFGDLIAEHRLVRQLVATDVAGELVDNMGIVWAHDLAAELGRTLDEVAAAFWVARNLTGAGELWADLERPAGLSADAEAALHAAVADQVGSLVRRYLLAPGAFDPAALLEGDRLLSETDGEGLATPGRRPDGGDEAPPQSWSDLGVDEVTARRYRRPERVVAAIRAAGVARACGGDLDPDLAAGALGSIADLPAVAAVEGAAQAFSGQDRDRRGVPRRLLVWQARSVLDDLAQWSEGLAIRLLADASAGDSPSQLVSAWAESHSGALGRAEALVRPVGPARSAGAGDPEALAGAVLAVRRLPAPG